MWAADPEVEVPLDQVALYILREATWQEFFEFASKNSKPGAVVMPNAHYYEVSTD